MVTRLVTGRRGLPGPGGGEGDSVEQRGQAMSTHPTINMLESQGQRRNQVGVPGVPPFELHFTSIAKTELFFQSLLKISKKMRIFRAPPAP